jgi:hypothetical protein
MVEVAGRAPGGARPIVFIARLSARPCKDHEPSRGCTSTRPGSSVGERGGLVGAGHLHASPCKHHERH